MKEVSPPLLEAVKALRAGRMIVMIDDEKRENEGDLIIAAQFATTYAINFMARQGCGLICLALEAEQIDKLALPPMVQNNRDPRGTAFTVSIEAARGVTTGISAADRAHTIQVAASKEANPEDIVSPGHIFPLKAHPKGVVGREGHTEGAVDVMRLAGLEPAGVICEIMAEDGQMMRLPELKIFAQKHHLPLISIAELKSWIVENGREALIFGDEGERIQSLKEVFKEDVSLHAALPSLYGGEDLKIHAFCDQEGIEHIALVKGEISSETIPLIRLHSECVTGDALGSLRCDCGPQLREALKRIGQVSSGILIYLRGHEGRGIGLVNKIKAYSLQDKGLDTVDANKALGFPVDLRRWDGAVRFLKEMGVSKLALLTNNPSKAEGLKMAGFEIVRIERLEIESNPFNHHYLKTKRTRMGHFLEKV